MGMLGDINHLPGGRAIVRIRHNKGWETLKPWALLATLLLTACGGGGGGTGGGGGGTGSSTYTVGGTVNGLSASGLVLTDNGGDSLRVSSGATTFTFATALTSGASYAVAVASQPSGETCTVASGSGTVGTGNVTSVAITCAAAEYTIGGTVSGLSVSGLVLTNNGGDSLSVSSGATKFTFATALAAGASYAVAVASQPSGEMCTVTSGSGTVGTGNVISVAITCAAAEYTIGGTVSGLSASGLVLTNNGGDSLRVSSGATTFTFATALTSGASYAVAVASQPSGQTCTVASGGGTVGTGNVTSVGVTCTANQYTVGGSVSGLTGSGLTLELNGAGNTSIAPGAVSFKFAQTLVAGANYAVTILTQPGGEICTVSGGSGTIAGDVSSVAIACVAQQYTISGTVSGLNTAGLQLQDYAKGEIIDVAAGQAAFQFTQSVAYGTNVDVTIVQQPSWETCTASASNFSGPVTANVSDEAFTCASVAAKVVTFAGTTASGSTDGTGAAAAFKNPAGVAVGPLGNIYVADSNNNEIREISPAGAVTTLAGSTTPGSADGTGAAAAFHLPVSVAVDAHGNVFVADTFNNEIREIAPGGVVTTFAGSTTPGSSDGAGSAASFNQPEGVAVDTHGNVYVADTGNNEIRMITPAGVVSTLAGTPVAGSADGTGATAAFNHPTGVAVDSSGDLIVADLGNNEIRRVTPAGVVTTLAGALSPGSADGTGAAASFSSPQAVAIDPAGNVYVADGGNNEIRVIAPNGIVTTLAGTTTPGSADGTGAGASFNNPSGVTLDASGNLYVGDFNNNEIRKITP